MKRFVLIIAIFFTSALYASPELVTWTLSNSIPEITTVNEVYSGEYTFTNESDNDLTTPLYLSIKISGGFLALDKCSGLKLAAKQSCKVEFNFAPQSKGMHTLSLTLANDSHTVTLPKLSVEAFLAKDLHVNLEEIDGSVYSAMTAVSDAVTNLRNYEFFTPFIDASNANNKKVKINDPSKISVAMALHKLYRYEFFTPFLGSTKVMKGADSIDPSKMSVALALHKLYRYEFFTPVVSIPKENFLESNHALYLAMTSSSEMLNDYFHGLIART